jgi:hypothetical protein
MLTRLAESTSKPTGAMALRAWCRRGLASVRQPTTRLDFPVSQHQRGIRPGTERPPVWAVVVAALSLLVRPSADRRKGSTLARAQAGDASGKGDDERGRGATTPSDIPLRGWKDIFWRVYHNIPEHRIVSIAAGVTFFVLLSIFPGIAALVAIYGLFADPSSIASTSTICRAYCLEERHRS